MKLELINERPHAGKTARFDVVLPSHDITLPELVAAILEQRPKEWGKIRVIGPLRNHILTLRYTHGQVVKTEPDNRYDSAQWQNIGARLTIKKVTTDGGWSRMDYEVTSWHASDPDDRTKG